MSSAATQPEPAPIQACTVSRDVQNFELLVVDMEVELGENWGDLAFEDARDFLNQPDADDLEFRKNHGNSDRAQSHRTWPVTEWC